MHIQDIYSYILDEYIYSYFGTLILLLDIENDISIYVLVQLPQNTWTHSYEFVPKLSFVVRNRL